jgi:hypothetical protein
MPDAHRGDVVIATAREDDAGGLYVRCEVLQLERVRAIVRRRTLEVTRIDIYNIINPTYCRYDDDRV